MLMGQAMFGNRYWATLLVCAAIAACVSPEPVQPITQKTFEPIKTACGERDGWSDPAPPAHVYGNVYMVGTCGITALLITTPDGHFLIDGATNKAAEGIADNIRKLGFDPKDVRYILGTHEHLDHVGGLAILKRITGAKFATRAEAKEAMASGALHPTDPQSGLHPVFEGIKADLIVGDGDQLRIGKLALTVIATPGHTPGGTSYTWKSCKGKNCQQLVFADSLGAVSADEYRFSDHPEYVAPLRTSIAQIASLKACDIMISPHPSQSDFFERLAGEMPLVDPNGCASYAANAKQRLDDRLAKEAGN